MGRKAGKYKKKEDKGLLKNKSIQFDSDNEDMMNDEIDAFHKIRDVVPLNINEDVEKSDEDAEQPVLGVTVELLVFLFAITQRNVRGLYGDVEDERLDDADEEEQRRVVWGPKRCMYGADVVSEEILDHGKPPSKASLDKGTEDEEGMTYEVIKKDLNALTEEEQMDVVYSSAPELIGLLSELDDALEQLQNKVNPFVEEIRGQESAKKGVLHYTEVKQYLLQSFCQAIAFYLLLKSEGQPVRDHPVVSHLVDIKSLLDKIKEMDDSLSLDMDDSLSLDMDDIFKKYVNNAAVVKSAPVESDSFNNSLMYPMVTSAEQGTVEPNKEAGLNTLKSPKIKQSEHKHQDKQVGPQSSEMLKIRASLDEKLKQQGVFSSIAPSVRTKRNQQPVNRQLETLDDFVDEAMEIDNGANGRSNGDANLLRSSKISQQLKRKVISGDDDIPKRDDIGERRRKYELRVLAGAGIKYGDGVENAEVETGNLSSDGADANGESGSDPDLELYQEVKRQRAAKLAAKSAKYSRTPEVSSLPETVDGKRHISNQIEKNRGLTRARKKLIKNPRKKYKLKHKKAEVRRKGQVRDIRKPAGSYGGEASGINAGVSRSVRFKS
ncbi:hypothetical protein C2S53_004178 [Perilla frutescens var. hirtella]|uniref:Sas10 C-terminal domain-containing protein n=1 Tax=Perilla frutescens var. hirtella TaxID=608512 RepID=A0AAD4PC27_PERFH|nr:hypothetical protein C2S53_004178 [Perilla frutescens var. hirtella]